MENEDRVCPGLPELYTCTILHKLPFRRERPPKIHNSTFVDYNHFVFLTAWLGRRSLIPRSAISLSSGNYIGKSIIISKNSRSSISQGTKNQHHLRPLDQQGKASNIPRVAFLLSPVARFRDRERNFDMPKSYWLGSLHCNRPRLRHGERNLDMPKSYWLGSLHCNRPRLRHGKPR